MWNASCTTRGISAGCWITNECLTIGIVMPNVSASWKPSVPSSSVRTWPVKATSGTESIIASVSGVTMFVAPGPEVANTTPTLPDRLRVALGGVPAAGLVAYEDVPDPRVDERVVGREVRAAGVAEYDVDAFGLEAFHDGVDGTHHRVLSSFERGGQRTESTGAAAAADSGSIADLGEVEIGAAAHAHRVVELDDLAAGRALAAQLVALGAVASATSSPSTGTTAPISDQMKNDEPLIRPTMPVATPNQSASAR